MTIAFIGFGEAGGILAADLAREHAVTIWDCKLNGPEREAMLSKARGFSAVESRRDLGGHERISLGRWTC